MLGGLGTGIWAAGAAMTEKASRGDVDAVRTHSADSLARARAEYDARLDAIEQGRSYDSATLKAIEGRLKSIDDKLDRIQTPRKTKP